MKVKFTIKTLEELLLTKGIKYKDEEFTCEGENDVFLFEMISFVERTGNQKKLKTERLIGRDTLYMSGCVQVGRL